MIFSGFQIVYPGLVCDYFYYPTWHFWVFWTWGLVLDNHLACNLKQYYLKYLLFKFLLVFLLLVIPSVVVTQFPYLFLTGHYFLCCSILEVSNKIFSSFAILSWVSSLLASLSMLLFILLPYLFELLGYLS